MAWILAPPPAHPPGSVSQGVQGDLLSHANGWGLLALKIKITYSHFQLSISWSGRESTRASPPKLASGCWVKLGTREPLAETTRVFCRPLLSKDTKDTLFFLILNFASPCVQPKAVVSALGSFCTASTKIQLLVLAWLLLLLGLPYFHLFFFFLIILGGE